jgi:hypothetical protein
MTTSLYQATVAQYLQILPGVIADLDKAEAWAQDQGLSEEEMLAKRLAPDMWPLAMQFRVISDHSAGALQALNSGRFTPDISEPPKDFATLRNILADTLSYVQAIEPAQLDAMQNKEVAFEFGGQVRMRFTGENFLLSFAQPNFYFHATTVYAILRSLGLPIGKRDYLGKARVIEQA